MPQVRKLFPPVVTGTAACLIGMTIFPVAIDWLGGDHSAADYGSLTNLDAGMAVFAVVVYLNQWFKGFISAAAIIIGLLAGYVLWFMLGRLDLSSIPQAAAFAIPNPLHFGIEFHAGAIIAMCIASMYGTKA